MYIVYLAEEEEQEGEGEVGVLPRRLRSRRQEGLRPRGRQGDGGAGGGESSVKPPVQKTSFQKLCPTY